MIIFIMYLLLFIDIDYSFTSMLQIHFVLCSCFTIDLIVITIWWLSYLEHYSFLMASSSHLLQVIVILVILSTLTSWNISCQWFYELLHTFFIGQTQSYEHWYALLTISLPLSSHQTQSISLCHLCIVFYNVLLKNYHLVFNNLSLPYVNSMTVMGAIKMTLDFPLYWL